MANGHTYPHERVIMTSPIFDYGVNFEVRLSASELQWMRQSGIDHYLIPPARWAVPALVELFEDEVRK